MRGLPELPQEQGQRPLETGLIGLKGGVGGGAHRVIVEIHAHLARRSADFRVRCSAMGGFWAVFWIAVVLKIPLVALLLIVWWAIKEPPVAELDDEDGGGSSRSAPQPRGHPPRPPRRGPHRGPEPSSPRRVRVARGRGACPPGTANAWRRTAAARGCSSRSAGVRPGRRAAGAGPRWPRRPARRRRRPAARRGRGHEVPDRVHQWRHLHTFGSVPGELVTCS